MDDCVQKVGGYFKQYYISKQRIQQPKKKQIQNPDITGSVTVLGTVLYSITFDADQDPSFHLDADPDQNFLFDADRDTAPY
jgi:hypothetical protein